MYVCISFPLRPGNRICYATMWQYATTLLLQIVWIYLLCADSLELTVLADSLELPVVQHIAAQLVRALVMLQRLRWYHIISHRIKSQVIISYHIKSNRILSYHIISYGYHIIRMPNTYPIQAKCISNTSQIQAKDLIPCLGLWDIKNLDFRNWFRLFSDR